MQENRVVFEANNEFGSFTVEELNYEGRPARLLFSGPLHAAQSGIPLDNDPRLLFDYNQRLLELAGETNPQKILVLGGGTLTLPMALIGSLPETKVTVVEQNALLVKLAKRFFGYQPNPRLSVVIDDAAKFMERARPTFDLILVDLYDNFTIPDSFRGSDFARQLRRGLKENGIVAANCIAGLGGMTSLPLIQLSRAYLDSIGPVKIIKADAGYSSYASQNLIVISSPKMPLSKFLKNGAEVEIPKLTDWGI